MLSMFCFLYFSFTDSENILNNGLFSQKKFICCNLGEDTTAVESVIVENGGKRS